MNKITELLKLQGIEKDFYKVSKGWIFENVELQDTYGVIKNSILSSTIPDWEADPEMKKEVELLKSLIGRLDLDQLKTECQLWIDIWNYADSCEYEDICELMDLKPLEALETINDIISVNDWVTDFSEVVEAWG